MLAIRLQRLGRKGYPVYRIAVQEAQRHPLSGRVVAYVGSYNPHTKQVKFDVEKVELYLKNGAQPSPHVVKLLTQEKVKMPAWVNAQDKKEKKLRNPEKLRKNQPAKPKVEPKEEPAGEGAEPAAEEAPAETPVKDDSSGESAGSEPSEEAVKPEAEESAGEPEPAAESPAEAPDKETKA